MWYKLRDYCGPPWQHLPLARPAQWPWWSSVGWHRRRVPRYPSHRTALFDYSILLSLSRSPPSLGLNRCCHFHPPLSTQLVNSQLKSPDRWYSFLLARLGPPYGAVRPFRVFVWVGQSLSDTFSDFWKGYLFSFQASMCPYGNRVGPSQGGFSEARGHGCILFKHQLCAAWPLERVTNCQAVAPRSSLLCFDWLELQLQESAEPCS